MNKQQQQKPEAELLSLLAKYQIEQDGSLDDRLKEAHKELIDAVKELFVYHDEDKTLLHIAKVVELLGKRQILP